MLTMEGQEAQTVSALGEAELLFSAGEAIP